MADFRLSDYGVLIRAVVILDGAPYDPSDDSTTFLFRTPSGQELEKVPSLDAMGDRVTLVYVVEEGFFAQGGVGRWTFRAIIQMATDPPKRITSNDAGFEVGG